MDEVHAYDFLTSTYGWDREDYDYYDEHEDFVYGDITWDDHNGLAGW